MEPVKRKVFNTGKGLLVPQSGAYDGIFLLCPGLAAEGLGGGRVFSATLAGLAKNGKKCRTTL